MLDILLYILPKAAGIWLFLDVMLLLTGTKGSFIGWLLDKLGL